MRPALRREVVDVLRSAYRISERRACSATGFHRSAQSYRFRRDPQVELRMRLRDLAAARLVAEMAAPPSLTVLAAEAGLTPVQMVRAFGRAYGLPPFAWLGAQLT